MKDYCVTIRWLGDHSRPFVHVDGSIQTVRPGDTIKTAVTKEEAQDWIAGNYSPIAREAIEKGILQVVSIEKAWWVAQ